MNRYASSVNHSETRSCAVRRTGATLVEVLMALLIMAIGVTSVFTLFPISILKAIRAHQQTDSKLYESAIKDTLLTHSQLWTGAPEWSENTVYGNTTFAASQQDLWVAPKRSERLVPDTNQLFVYVPTVALPAAGTSGANPPNFQLRRDWNATQKLGGYQNFYAIGNPAWLQATFDGPLRWIPYRHSPDITDLTKSVYMVDPLGWHRRDPLSLDRYRFGRIISGDVTAPVDESYLDRIHCQLGPDAANQFFRLTDTWSVVTDTTVLETAVTFPLPGIIEITFPATVDVTALDANHRIILSSTQTARAVELPIQTPTSFPAPGVVRFPAVLPAGYAAVADQARIEVHSPSRYSWLMAVRSTSAGRFEAQCAVVFNRTFEDLDEQGYRAEFAERMDLDGDATISANEFNVAKVRWPYDPNSDPPRFQAGGYIFDASHGYWYQIKKVVKFGNAEQVRVDAADNPDPAGAYVRTIVLLNDSVKASTGPSFIDYQTYSEIDPIGNPQVDCQAVLIPGVIHVFSMTPESPL